MGLVSLLRPEAPQVLLQAARGIAREARAAEAAREVDGEVGTCDDPGPPDHGLVLPTGAPTSLHCDDARAIVEQAQTLMAAVPPGVDAAKFADAMADWLDPHGLWSAAPDAPAGAVIRRLADGLLEEIQAPQGSGPCSAALEVGRELTAWSAELRQMLDEGAREGNEKTPHLLPARSLRASRAAAEEAFRFASSTPFEDGAVTHSARDLAHELGRELGALDAAYGASVAPYTEASKDRAAPPLSEDDWSEVVIAAAVRAYIPQLDAHGAWAPLDEEISIYDLGLEADPPERLWTEMTRTAVGVRIDHGAVPPLEDGDVVLRVQGVALAGVSVEQAEQLSVSNDGHNGAPTKVTVLRPRGSGPVEVEVMPAAPGVASSPPPPDYKVDFVRYADGRAAVVAIPDVPDDLGARLGAALDRARAARDVRGLVLDLRANGGGSTDGAIAALGMFLPGASLFPMRRRDGGIEVERAPDVPADKRWNGPVAVLVDGDSASAAEMIAGALSSYHRAVVIGDRTYGKGCAQEYLDDDAHAGVLRLTTLLFCLPDGAPVQKTGILPNVRLSLPAATEREAMVTRALEAWRGPDVREGAKTREVPWPTHGGRVGPCRDETICRALRAVGAAPAAAR
jgi:carboxyl-terminal processing protease